MANVELKLEQVSVHSRDLACRYVFVKAGETLSYSIKPHKNSIFYGIYRQSSNRATGAATLKTAKSSTASTLAGSMNFEDRLRQAQLESVTARTKLTGGKVYKNSLDVVTGGMYALVFDNTFSKQKSKLVTFILQIYPTTGEAPKKEAETLVDDEDSVPEVFEEHLSGLLMKRRRKKLQGWARRWFVLDFESNTLNYYLNQESTVLRGAIPLKVAVFSANRQSLEINIDSGAEIWNLRAQSSGSFTMWCQALAASRESKHDVRTHLAPGFTKKTLHQRVVDKSAQKDKMPEVAAGSAMTGTQLQEVLSGLKSIRENLRDVIMKELSPPTDAVDDRSRQSSPSKPPRGPDTMKIDTQSLNIPRKNFWGKRRPSELAVISPSTDNLLVGAKASNTLRGALFSIESQMEHLLNTFDGILVQNSTSNELTRPRLQIEGEVHRSSFDSTRTADEVWADAESGYEDTGFLLAHHDSESELDEEDDDLSSDDESIAQKLLFEHETVIEPRDMSSVSQFGKQLHPLEILVSTAIQRRTTIPKILDQPPSTLKLMTSKVGSDVSSMSAPAASNEPLGLLQRVAEELEYSQLLDTANSSCLEDGTRILMIAAFAVSSFSSMRQKERAKRKPFNPMLGETYELVREDKHYRFVAEKVQHRPLVGVASCAESDKWSFHQYQATSQKFYGKSMLLTTEGITTVKLRTGDVYTWEKPELYLKGITWGERFIEPSGEMIIRNLVNGEAAIVTFVPAKGWGAGRSEEVIITAYDPTNKQYDQSITGTWTTSLSIDKSIIWTAGTLVDDPNARCGFTTFAAQLNEITRVEKGHLPRTDSRLRPDMRAREQGNLEEAEIQKVKVEEGQRRRRAELEEAGKVYEPRYFECAPDGKTWSMKDGQKNYWVERQQGFVADDIVDLFGSCL